VLEQVQNLAKTNIIQNAMRSRTPPRLHGLVYDIADGVLKDLQINDHEIMGELGHIYATAAVMQDEIGDAPASTTPTASAQGE
jgi:carbonic anhydrase